MQASIGTRMAAYILRPIYLSKYLCNHDLSPPLTHSSLLVSSGDDVCGICRAPFDGNPPEANFPGDDAPVVWGVCSHAFHIQCINKWLSSQPEQKCPFCRRAWEFKHAETGAARGAQVAPQQTPAAAIRINLPRPNTNNNDN